MKTSIILIGALMGLMVSPGFARVEDYGARRFTQVGHRPEFHNNWGHSVVIDRRHGPGWGGVLAGSILGAAAGLALGSAIGGPPVVVAAPVMGSVVPVLPGSCVTVPSYNGSVLYDCGNIYYQPFYEGTSLMFEVVPAP